RRRPISRRSWPSWTRSPPRTWRASRRTCWTKKACASPSSARSTTRSGSNGCWPSRSAWHDLGVRLALLTIAVVLVLAGCGGGGKSAKSTTQTVTTTTVVSTTTSTQGGGTVVTHGRYHYPEAL